MNLIDTNITPDPFDPQTGDVYEFGAPFVQRLVIEDAPSNEDPRVRYRIDGGTDSNLTSVAQFHRHLAGLTDLRGIGRVRECSPLKPDEVAALTWEARFNDGRGGASIYLGGHTAFVSGKEAHDLAEALYPRRTQVQSMRDDIDAWFRWALGNIDDVSLATASGERLRKNLQEQLDRVHLAEAEAAVMAERKFASDRELELDSISAFIAPHGVATPAGAAKPRSLELVRWLAVTGGVVPHACHPTLAEVQEAQEVDFRARWDRYASAQRNPAIGEPARPEVGEVDHFPTVAETRALGLRAEVHRTVAKLRDLSLNSQWPIRERLQSAAAVMLAVLRERDLSNAATLCTLPPSGANADRTEPRANPIYCTGFVTVLAVKDRQIVQRQSWTSDRPSFNPTDVSFHDDDARFTPMPSSIQRTLELGDRQGTWTWRGSMGSFPDKQQWQGEWTEEQT